MRFRGVLFEPGVLYAARIDRHFDVPWTEPDILALFASASAERKEDQQLWGPGLYDEGARRGNAGLHTNTALVFDTDYADPGDMDWVCDRLIAAGRAFVVYTSWSHGSPDKIHADTGRRGPFDCFRIILPTDRDITPEEYRVLSQGALGFEMPSREEHYLREVHGLTVPMPSGRERLARPRGLDAVSFRPSQGYYVPGPHSIVEVHRGRPVDVEAALARPHTARPSARRLRPYIQPSETAEGALKTLDSALRRHGFGLSEPSVTGWSRSVCPSCQSASPSLIARANGDSIDLKCWALCSRYDILAALGLPISDEFAEVSEARQRVEEQLEAQTPRAQAVPVNEAVQRLEADLRHALDAGRPTVLRYPAGTGKSFASAKVIAEQVRQGESIVYATQEHVVAQETRSLLPPDIRARSVHLHSPLVLLRGEPQCPRTEELKEMVFDFGLSLRGQICPRCPQRDGCDALAAARDRQDALGDANVIFCSHAGIRQIFKGDRALGVKLVVDEMPSTFESLSVDAGYLKGFARGAPMPSAALIPGKLVQAYARMWVESLPTPPDLTFGDQWFGTAAETLAQYPRIGLRDGAHPSPEEREWLQAADGVLRLASWQAEGGQLTVESSGVSAMVPDACHEALVQTGGVLLSATPLLPALPGFDVRDVAVTDGATIRRIAVPRADRGSGWLTERPYDERLGRRERVQGSTGIDWPAVDAALARARAEAKRYDCKRILFVTFKKIADVLRRQPDRLGNDIEVGHYGALRGKNEWMEGKPKEVSVVYCFGTPRFDLRSTLFALGFRRDALAQTWADCAAGELTQAEGRLRLPRRTKPCSVIVEGDVMPSDWHLGNVTEIDDLDFPTFTGAAEDWGIWGSLPEGYDPAVGLPLPTSAPQTPGLPEAMRLLSKMGPERLQLLGY